MDLLGIVLITGLFGKKSGGLTILVAFVFAGFDWFFQYIPNLTGNLYAHPILAAVLGGVLLGLGEGLLLRQNISSGIDASVALLIKEKFGISPSLWYTLSDALILGASYLLVPELNLFPTLLAVLSANIILALFEGDTSMLANRRGAYFVPLWQFIQEQISLVKNNFHESFSRERKFTLLQHSLLSITEPITDNLP